MKTPWWFCCGWRSYWCVADTVLHALHLKSQWICGRHDAAIMASVEDDWVDELPTRQLRHHFDAEFAKGEPVEIRVSPDLRVTSTWPVTTGPPQTWGNSSSTFTYVVKP